MIEYMVAAINLKNLPERKNYLLHAANVTNCFISSMSFINSGLDQ